MSENATQSLLQAVPFPMMAIGPDQLVIATNSGCDALLGAGLRGRHYVTALRQPALLDRIEEVLRTGQPATARYLGRDGAKDTTYLVHLAPANGLLIVTFEDRTAAEAVSQLRRDFVANVSHELRSPLTALTGFIETLRGPARDDAKARDRFLGIMERETQRMTRLVGDLLSLSRVEENERQRPGDAVDLTGLLRTALAEMEPLIQVTGAAIELDLPADEITVPGDAGQLRQVIGNLLENALKYGQDQGAVQIRISKTGLHAGLRQEGVALAVRNGGAGIAAHHIPRLTERFYRVDAHRSREVGGTGLGLAIVKHIVNRHRGRLRIESTPQDGTTVTVILPASLPADRPSPTE